MSDSCSRIAICRHGCTRGAKQPLVMAGLAEATAFDTTVPEALVL